MREIENHHQNNTVTIAGGDPPMDAEISAQKFEEKQDICIVSKCFL